MPYAIAIAVLLVLAGGYYLMSARNTAPPPDPVAVTENVVVPESGQDDSADQGTADVNAPVAKAPASEADRLYEEKQVLYQRLEKARRDLERRLARIKVSLWNVKLPRQEAAAMTEQLMSAARLLQRPKLMGAFHNLEEIEQELIRVEYAKERVRELRQAVEENKQQAVQ